MQAETLIYRDKGMAEIVARARKAAQQSADVLIEGAPGAGKTTLAHFIAGSHRDGDPPLVEVHCAAEKQPAAQCESAEQSGATLFLHHITELEPAAQAELAMRLRTRGRSPQIIATSARDIDKALHEGRFRHDLFYRLGIVRVQLPALAERPDDIPALARHFTARFASALGLRDRVLTGEALEKLKGYHWPGNVRELENVIHRAVVFAEGEQITGNDIDVPEIAVCADETAESDTLVGRTVAEVERDLILGTLRHCAGNRTQAADILGISVRTLRNKIRQYLEEGADVPAFHRAA